MKKSRFTKSKIVSILKEADAGRKVADISRKHGISEATYFHWKAISGLNRMKETLEEFLAGHPAAFISYLTLNAQ